MAFDLGHPVFDGGETVSVGDVVGDDDTVGALVVGGGDGLESFLSRSVPNLKLDCFSVHLDGPDFEVNSDCRHEVVSEHVVGEAQQEGRFSNS